MYTERIALIVLTLAFFGLISGLRSIRKTLLFKWLDKHAANHGLSRHNIDYNHRVAFKLCHIQNLWSVGICTLLTASIFYFIIDFSKKHFSQLIGTYKTNENPVGAQ